VLLVLNGSTEIAGHENDEQEKCGVENARLGKLRRKSQGCKMVAMKMTAMSTK